MTIKEYYNDSFLIKCRGEVVEITAKGVIFDRTVAFPEGGGQEGDSGFITNVKTGQIINFTYATKQGGEVLNLENFHSINIRTDVVHHIDESELHDIVIGQQYQISIDVERRAKITLLHSGIHIVLQAIDSLRPGIENHIFGAKISDSSARLDFRITERFQADELDVITEKVNQIINEDKIITVFPHKEASEALYWKCDQFVIPCGGTHLTKSGCLGKVILKRKNIGKNAERIIATFENHSLPYNLYHV